MTGRKGKRFCDQYCKSAHQYANRKVKEAFYYKVDRQLKINRKILKKYHHSGISKIRKEELLEAGFNPHFFTHYYKTMHGNLYLFCYEYGFMDLQKDGEPKYLMVNWQDYMAKT